MTTRVDLLGKTRRAWNRSPVPRRGAGPPAPGDVVVLECTACFDVEWAVLARDPAHPGRLLAVAADGQAMVGSADVAVPASAPGGPLVLRCRFGGWIDGGLIDTATRTATLPQDEVACARDRRAEVERGTVAGSILACEVDDDPEYQDWVAETLEPAWLAFAKTGPVLVPEVDGAAERHGRIVEASAPAWQTAGARSLALAATVLLALGAGLFWRQHQELSDLRDHHQVETEEYRHEIGELRSENGQREDGFRRQLEEAGNERERLESDARLQLEELGQQLDHARRQTVVGNPVALSLDFPRGRRGDERRVYLPTDASHVLFFMTLEGAEPGQTYGAELHDRATGERLWAKGELRPELRELRFGLPRSQLPPGEYLLRILELADGSSELMAEVPLRILAPQARR
ncbi:MAG: hypothetical protein GY719_42695 [bacterium]|nr:hypothetical protein [bacterium]